MGASSRRDGTPLIEELYQRPSRFQFFQAVRLLGKVNSDRAGVGRDNDPNSEFVRFRSDISYAFPTGDVRSIERFDPDEDQDPDRFLRPAERPDDMVVNFLGIATPASFGSLPTPFVEEIRYQERNKNFAMREFLDLFNHRLVSLFYRAWERTRAEVLYDLDERSPFESALRAIIGLEGDVQTRRLPFDSRDILSRAGLISMRPASETAIKGLVSSLFDIPATVEQFLPCWYEMDDADRTQLGHRNSKLGDDMSLGSEVCLSQWRFRVRLGPMNFDMYQALLPEGKAFHLLSSVIRLATGPECDTEYTLVLEKEEVPGLQLGASDSSEVSSPCRLGWSTWLKCENRDRDADDAVFTPSLEREEAMDSLEMRR
jgi:type VI secretion system protein ImpH